MYYHNRNNHRGTRAETKERSHRLDPKVMWSLVCALGVLDVYFAAKTVGAYQEKKEIDALVNGPSSVCDTYFADLKGTELHKAAADCLDSRYGKVALVGYGMSPELVAKVADESEAVIAQGTNGLVRPEIVPVVASSDTELAHKSVNIRCDYNEVEKSGAYVADKTMELDEYNHVIALIPSSDCLGSGSGLSFLEYRSRYADVYEATSKPEYESSYTGVRNSASSFVAHELGHAFINHVDTVRLRQGGYKIFEHPPQFFDPASGGFASPDFIVNNDSEDAESFRGGRIADLTPPSRKLSESEYFNYGGESNLMAQLDSRIYPLGYQQWQLEWPERALGEVRNRKHTVNESSIVLQQSDSSEKNFMSLILEEPVSIIHTNPFLNETKDTFNELIFDQTRMANNQLNVYFVNSSTGHIVQIGELNFDTGTADKVRISVHNQIVEISYDASSGFIFTDESRP